jgi:hypothetical protein
MPQKPAAPAIPEAMQGAPQMQDQLDMLHQQNRQTDENLQHYRDEQRLENERLAAQLTTLQANFTLLLNRLDRLPLAPEVPQDPTIPVQDPELRPQTHEIFKDKMPEFNKQVFQHDNHDFDGLCENTRLHFDAIDVKLIPFRRNPEFQSRAGNNRVLNELAFRSLVPVLAKHVMSRNRREHLMGISFREFMHEVYQSAKLLEFQGDIIAYLARNKQADDEPLASFHATLSAIQYAFPDEVTQLPVLLKLFESYADEFQMGYLSRHVAPPHDTNLTLDRLMQRMGEIDKNLQYAKQRAQRGSTSSPAQWPLHQRNGQPTSAPVCALLHDPYASNLAGQQGPSFPSSALFTVRSDSTQPALPGGTTRAAQPPASVLAVELAYDWTVPNTKDVFAHAFEHREQEAWKRQSSSMPVENEVATVMLITKQLNDPQFEPLDDNQIDTCLQMVRFAIHQHATICPGFKRQLQQLLENKTRALEMSRNKECWNCGQLGHMRAQCPRPRRHFSTDFHKP